MTTQQENEVISEWAGIVCRCYDPETQEIALGGCYHVWRDCPRHCDGGLPPDYDRDEVAVGMLSVLVSKGYYPMLGWVGDMLRFNILEPGWMMLIDNHLEVIRPTIASAIKSACLQLVGKENP